MTKTAKNTLFDVFWKCQKIIKCLTRTKAKVKVWHFSLKKLRKFYPNKKLLLICFLRNEKNIFVIKYIAAVLFVLNIFWYFILRSLFAGGKLKNNPKIKSHSFCGKIKSIWRMCFLVYSVFAVSLPLR